MVLEIVRLFNYRLKCSVMCPDIYLSSRPLWYMSGFTLLYKLEFLMGFPPLRETVSPHVKNLDNFSCMFEITNQLLTCHSYYFILFLTCKLRWLLLLGRYLYNEHSNTWLCGNLELLLECSTQYLTHSLCPLVRYGVEFHISAHPCVVIYFPSYLLFRLL